MSFHFEAAPLVASPSYPDSVKWSKDNLIAVASGHLVTILNPASLMSPRGLIALSANKPLPFGLVETEGLRAACLMPASLTRDICPCARSISWSDPGLTTNSGCLLAVCTTAGRVKLFRPPFGEFCADWIEVKDLSEIMFNYLESINFADIEETSSIGRTEARNVAAREKTVSRKVLKPRKKKATSRRTEDGHTKSLGSFLHDEASSDQDMLDQGNSNLAASAEEPEIESRSQQLLYKCSKQDASGKCSSPKSKKKSREKKGTNELPRITAEKYASWSAFLSSLVVAWSPMFQSTESINCSILAIGSKSGGISFWGFYEPHFYTIEHGMAANDAVLIGFLQAHNSWVTAISWGIYETSSSVPRLLLATGSSDGSVKVWMGDTQSVMRPSNSNQATFSLLKEVIAVTSVPISVMSLACPVKYPDKITLAIGKGSGMLEIWRCCMSDVKFETCGAYDAHDQVVTGLAWTSDGSNLYTCSQDNSMRSWTLDKKHLSEMPFPSNFAGGRSSSNAVQISDPCFGLSLSPGESMITMVRSLDTDLLNPMYQRRQKAAVEFFWVGGHLTEISSDSHLGSVKAVCGLSARELACWELNILRTLNHYDNARNVLVLWDVLAALIAFRKSAPRFLEIILVKWLSSWFPGSHPDASLEMIVLHAQSLLLNISTRRLQLLNIVCRRLMLCELKANASGEKQNESSELSGDSEGQQKIWTELLLSCERELRERLVAFTFQTVLQKGSSTSVGGNNLPLIGLGQMERWVSTCTVHEQLKLLVSKMREESSRISNLTEEEACSFCSAQVPFVSPEYGCCEGVVGGTDAEGSHKLARCSVSMKLCPISSPNWFCICCRRWAATLAPQQFFALSCSPLLVDCGIHPTSSNRARPYCPFCGILLQRMLPDYLLSTSPV